MELETYKDESSSGASATKREFPTIHFYDQGFVDIYNQTWAWSSDFIRKSGTKSKLEPRFFNYPDSQTVVQFDSILSTFFLVYSNRIHSATAQLDNFYGKQEPNGAIRGEYSV